MEKPACPFFYTARSFGINIVVLSFVDAPFLDWNGRVAYIAARNERERWMIYAADLMWVAVKDRYSELPMPSEIAYPKKKDTRTAKQIMNDLINNLGD